MKNIKDYFNNQKKELKEKFKNYKKTFAVIQVGNNQASNTYIKNKKKDCEEVGIQMDWYYFDEAISEKELVFELDTLQKHYDAVMVQMPLPRHINPKVIQNKINPMKDVDGFNAVSAFSPCTPKGIIDYLAFCGWKDFSGKNVVIIGRSDIVGRPLAKMMTDLNATVSLCHSRTKNLSDYIDLADLIICAVGKKDFLNCYSIHIPVIDVGINFDENGKMVGDCFNTDNREVTPVPGGVGLLTRLALLENILQTKKGEINE